MYWIVDFGSFLAFFQITMNCWIILPNWNPLLSLLSNQVEYTNCISHQLITQIIEDLFKFCAAFSRESLSKQLNIFLLDGGFFLSVHYDLLCQLNVIFNCSCRQWTLLKLVSGTQTTYWQISYQAFDHLIWILSCGTLSSRHLLPVPMYCSGTCRHSSLCACRGQRRDALLCCSLLDRLTFMFASVICRLGSGSC